MSIRITTDVFCDGSGCLAWTHGTVGNRSYQTGARAEAATKRWVSLGVSDYCPSCVESLQIAQRLKRKRNVG